MISKFSTFRTLAIAGLALSVLNGAQAADFHPITSITSSTAADDFFPVINLIQEAGVGFDAAEPHAAVAPTADTLWVTAAPGGAADYYETTGTAPVIVIDLGSDVVLSEISTWGYSSGNSNGVKDFSLRFATDAEGTDGFGTSITYNPTFSTELDPLPRNSNLFNQSVTARYVEFIGFDNYGGGGIPGGDRVGLGEIAFENRVVPDDPTISVPAAIELQLSASIETEDITVANLGAAALNITGTAFTGTNAAAFSVNSVPATIAAQSADIIQIEFDPTGLEAPVSATLQIMSNDPATPTAEIVLTGTVPPAAQDIVVSNPTIDRSLSAPKTTDIPVGNAGGTALSISSTSLTGPDASAFSILSAPASVAPLGSETIQVQIDPSGLQGLISATLLINSDDPDTPVAEVLIEAVALGDAAEFFPITAAEVDTAANDLWPVSNLIQGPGTGFDSATPYTKLIDGAAGNWVTNACGFPCDYIATTGMPIMIFDLGENVPLGEISLWGYAATNSNGLSEFSLRFATESEGPAGFGASITYNPLFGGIDSGEFPNLDNTSRFSFPFEEGAFARYVELTCVDNHFIAPGNGSGGEIPGGDRVGLGEVAFAIVSALPGNQFAITSIALVAGEVELVFKSRPGLTYGVYRSTDLKVWEELDDSFASGGEATTFVDDDVPGGAPRVFYQIRPGAG